MERKQINLLKQPLAIAVIIVLVVTMFAVGINTFTGNATWFSKFRRAPLQAERSVQTQELDLNPERNAQMYMNSLGCQCRDSRIVCGDSENTAETCNDNRDNDLDGSIDCADSGCFGIQFSYNGVIVECSRREGSSAFSTCNDRFDNDADGLRDCDDPDCANAEYCLEIPTRAGCSETDICDGIDNDCNGIIDDNIGSICQQCTAGECQRGYSCVRNYCILNVPCNNAGECQRGYNCVRNYCIPDY